MSSKTRLDNAYENAKIVDFDDTSKIIFLVTAIEVITVLQMILQTTETSIFTP